MKECKRPATISNIAKPCDAETFDKVTRKWQCSENYGKCQHQGKKLKKVVEQ